LPVPRFNLGQVQAVVILQIENAHEVQLMSGNLVQRLAFNADLLAMSEVEEPLLDQRSGTMPRNRRRPSKKNVEHDPASLL
jgi:hypothetical protein